MSPRRFWIQRVYRFNKQMFPFFPNAVVFILQFSVSYLILSKILNISLETSRMAQDLFVGSLSLVLFVYLFRCFDEVKDYATDKINFPERPLPAGVLSLLDFYILQASVVALLIVLNLGFTFQSSTKIGFAIVLLFTLFASRWFFAENWIRPSLPLALLTHNPVVYLYQIYVLSFYSLQQDILFSRAGLFLLSFAVTGTAWEISRKIRGTTEEDTYTTYSKIWGRSLPLILVFLLLVSSFCLSIAAFINQGPSWLPALWVVPGFIIISLVWKILSFWKDQRKAPVFRTYVEIYMFSLIILCIPLYFLI